MVSIVIPVLNEDRYIGNCLKSLISQDYPGDYEIIIVDNGSSDNTVVIARSFGARVVSCPEKCGVFHARQVGAEAARGEIIVQADADTLYPPGWLSRIVRQLAAHPEAVAVAGRFFYTRSPWWSIFEHGVRHGVNFITTPLLKRPLIVSGATFAFRRQAFMEAGGYKGLTYSADQYGISRRLSKLGKVIYDKDLIVYTSPRRVAQKPVPVLLCHAVRNITRLCIHVSATLWQSVITASQKTRLRRIAVRLSLGAIVPLIVVAYGYFAPAAPVFGEVYHKIGKEQKMIALTFNDGPNEPYTSEILDILDTYNVRATFFVIGQNVERYPETARRILAEGHVIGNHSYSHNTFHALSDFGAEDLKVAQRVIFRTLGVTPHLYRPPHGTKTPWELKAAENEGMIVVTWSVSTNEISVPSAEKLAENIVNEVDPGEIILLHDGHGTDYDSERADKSLLVEALPLMIEKLKAEGYRFVTVPSLLNVPEYND